MEMITEVEFVEDAGKILERVTAIGDEIVITRRNQQIARIMPVRHKMTAKEVFADIYGILSDDAAEGWYEDCKKQNLASEIRNPWDF